MVKKVDWESLSIIFNRMNESPGYYMMLVQNKWDRGISGVLGGYNTTRTQLELLTCIAKLVKDGKPVTQKDVVDFVRQDKTTVSEVMKTLEKKGYITRSTSEGDMRVKYITLTDKGFRLVKTAAFEVMQFDEQFFPDNSDSKELKRLLKKYL